MLSASQLRSMFCDLALTVRTGRAKSSVTYFVACASASVTVVSVNLVFVVFAA
ncbi:hypothetical protein SGLAM104S_04122 [Streptomyces glaucescens]